MYSVLCMYVRITYRTVEQTDITPTPVLESLRRKSTKVCTMGGGVEQTAAAVSKNIGD